MLKKPLTVAATLAGALGLYLRYLRRRHMTWGATQTEATGPLPGDELVPYADIVATRAVEIAAPRPDVWPWVVRLGPNRRGARDGRVERRDEVRVGDEFLLSGATMRAEIVEPEKTLAFRSRDGTWVWSLELVPVNGGTRLISRNRFDRSRWTTRDRLGYVVMEPGTSVMERKLLLRIKRLAEQVGGSDERSV